MAFSPLKALSKTFRFLTVLSILMVLILIGQELLQAVLRPFFQTEEQTNVTQDEKILSPEEQRQLTIANAQMEFSPEGMLYLLVYREPNETCETPSFMMPPDQVFDIYDSGLNLLWTSKSAEKSPFEFIINVSNTSRTDSFTGNQDVLKDKFIIPVFTSVNELQECWLYDSTKNIFIGYDTNKKIIGYCSSTGFTDNPEQVTPLKTACFYGTWKLPKTNKFQLIWQTEHNLYLIDFNAHSFSNIFNYDNAAINKVIFKRAEPSDDTASNSHHYLMVQTDNQMVFLIQKDTRHITQLQFPSELIPYVQNAGLSYWKDQLFLQFEGVTGSPAQNTKAHIQWYKQFRNKPIPKWIELYRIEKDGMLVKLTRFEYIRPVTYYSTDPSKKEIPLYLSCTTNLDPILFRWISSLKIIQDADWYPGSEVFYLFTEFIDTFHPHLPTIVYSATGFFMLLMLVHYWPRRTSWVKGGFWLVVVFLFNAAGFLTYLALNHYPVIRCQSCRSRRGLNRLDCPSCGAALPTPQSRPIDIINPPSSTKTIDIL